MILPQDIVNRALDALGAGTVIGDFSDGTKESEWARRNYTPIIRQILQSAHWNFARKRAPLELKADASGQTLDPATGEPISTAVEPPWTYAYAWPVDGVQLRWLPWLPPASNPIGQTPPVPLTTGATQTPWYPPMPARFLVATTDQFPPVVGQADWTNLPDLTGTEGVGLTGRRIILTDVPNAEAVYTQAVMDPNQWDPLMQQAAVACLAERAAVAVLPDRKIAVAERAAQIALAKRALTEARVANGNDAGFPQTTNHQPSWITGRNGGGLWRGPWGAQTGNLGYDYIGWGGYAFSDGSVF